MKYAVSFYSKKEYVRHYAENAKVGGIMRRNADRMFSQRQEKNMRSIFAKIGGNVRKLGGKNAENAEKSACAKTCDYAKKCGIMGTNADRIIPPPSAWGRLGPTLV